MKTQLLSFYHVLLGLFRPVENSRFWYKSITSSAILSACLLTAGIGFAQDDQKPAERSRPERPSSRPDRSSAPDRSSGSDRSSRSSFQRERSRSDSPRPQIQSDSAPTIQRERPRPESQPASPATIQADQAKPGISSDSKPDFSFRRSSKGEGTGSPRPESPTLTRRPESDKRPTISTDKAEGAASVQIQSIDQPSIQTEQLKAPVSSLQRQPATISEREGRTSANTFDGRRSRDAAQIESFRKQLDGARSSQDFRRPDGYREGNREGSDRMQAADFDRNRSGDWDRNRDGDRRDGDRRDFDRDHRGGDWDRHSHYPPPRPVVNPKVVFSIQANFGGYGTYWTNDWYHRHNHNHYWRPTIAVEPVFWWGTPRWGTTWGWFYGYAPYYYRPRTYSSFVYTNVAPNPLYYNYGDNIVYRGDMVYINGVPYVSADKYYEQSLDLAKRGEKTTVIQIVQPNAVNISSDMAPLVSTTNPVLAPVPNLYAGKNKEKEIEPVIASKKAGQVDPSEEWMPLGTFAILDDQDSEKSSIVMQLAMNRGGIVRGNFYNEKTDELKQIIGAVDQETQRVAIRVIGEEDRVYECGLWNLTQESLSMLVQEGKNKQQTKNLVRLKDPNSKETQNDDIPFPQPTTLKPH